MTMGERIKYLRKQERVTQEELGKHIGVTKQCISHWEIGKRRPDPEQQEALADFFNVDINYLHGISDYMTAIVSDKERAVLNAYRAADDVTREMVRRILNIKG